MKIGCVGGGPGGLLTAILVRLADPSCAVTVLERNAPDDTFGFGVVFSDETLANLRVADPVVFDRIEAEFRHWPDIDIHYRGRVLTSGGHGFAAIERRRLLAILTDRATGLGADVRFRTEVSDPVALAADYDVLVGSDGVRSAVRNAFAEHFKPSVTAGRSKYIWLGTTKVLDRFVFAIAETPHGVVQAHAYPYSESMSTWIVETDPTTWAACGLDTADPIAFTKELFADHLDGHDVVGNNSRWLDFPTVSNETWRHRNVVLLGDAAHTAHFSIGSGTKLAMEDAIALAAALTAGEPLDGALRAYETERRAVVASTQRAADTSREWFEGIRRFVGLPPEQFAFQLLTRSQRITYDNLRLRDAGFTAEILEAFWKATPEHVRPADPATPPMFYPFELRGLRLANRVVVSPMAQYSAVDGVPNDWHLVHLGSRAVGGASLVMTEMTCVSPEGRITHGCTGLWNDTQRDAWARVVTFVHEQTPAKIGLQLGHSGRKGSCVLPWEGNDDDPLPVDGWDVLGPSPLPYRPDSPVPREMTAADLDKVREQFVQSARYGAEAGFDLLELHMAHGYLLSSFISPLTNLRDDEYGGSLENRMRFPLEVLAAVRAVWDGPLSVRISATDWADGGLTGDDAVEVARLLVAGGCDVLDVSTGQVVKHARPRYGRLYQTPYADRIRQEVGCPTMTVGAVSSVDDVNTVILAGRADLCLLARPHLVDPYWTLNAAIDQGHDEFPWPPQYLTAKNARRREQQP